MARFLSGRQRYTPLVYVLPFEQASLAATQLTMAVSKRVHDSGENFGLGTATGSSWDLVKQHLIQAKAEGAFDFGPTDFGRQLDNYRGLTSKSPQDYRSELESGFWQPMGVNRDQWSVPPTEAVSEMALLARIDDFDREILRRKIDCQWYGIGVNGHAAFCEPFPSTEESVAAFVNQGTSIVDLHEQTRIDNSRNFGGNLDLTPKQAVSQFPKTFLNAGMNIVVVNDKVEKAEATRRGIIGDLCGEVPISVLRLAKRVVWFVAPKAAAELPSAQNIKSEWPGAEVVLDKLEETRVS